MEKLTLRDARKILTMLNGTAVASSSLSHRIASILQEEGVLIPVTNGSRCKYRIAPTDHDSCRLLISQHFGLQCTLEEFVEHQEAMKEDDGSMTRAEQVRLLGDSKSSHKATFKGFLVNCYEPIDILLGKEHTTLCPPVGSCSFIYDTTNFSISSDIVIIGIENSENFLEIRRQRHLFSHYVPDAKLLFVARYPQNNALALRQWLSSIPNRYIHFGDFDLAGIHIYLTEFSPWLGLRSEYLIPDDIEQRLKNGNASLYDRQYMRFARLTTDDPKLNKLIALIHLYKKGYEQEGYIQER